MSEKRVVGRSVTTALGIICIILTSGIVGVIVNYMSVISDKDSAIKSKDNQIDSLDSQISDQNNTISSLNSQISQLVSNITNLQNQVAIQQKILNDLLNVTATVVTVDEITLNASAWLNKTVIVEGQTSRPWYPLSRGSAAV
jgi:uncharacterized coiled-coil protein SlyX